jgi:hypothetical protein
MTYKKGNDILREELASKDRDIELYKSMEEVPDNEKPEKEGKENKIGNGGQGKERKGMKSKRKYGHFYMVNECGI